MIQLLGIQEETSKIQNFWTFSAPMPNLGLLRYFLESQNIELSSNNRRNSETWNLKPTSSLTCV